MLTPDSGLQNKLSLRPLPSGVELETVVLFCATLLTIAVNYRVSLHHSISEAAFLRRRKAEHSHRASNKRPKTRQPPVAFRYDAAAQCSPTHPF